MILNCIGIKETSLNIGFKKAAETAVAGTEAAVHIHVKNWNVLTNCL
jgi:hypothetical protein